MKNIEEILGGGDDGGSGPFSEEFLKFERVEKKLSNRPDIHAFILLDCIVPGTRDMVSSAGHDEIYLEVNCEALEAAATREQLIELHRCGVRYDGEFESLCMFV